MIILYPGWKDGNEGGCRIPQAMVHSCFPVPPKIRLSATSRSDLFFRGAFPKKGNLAQRNAALAFTLIELLVVIGIIAILMALLIPVIGRVQDSAKKTACISNLRQIGVAMPLFAAEHNGCYPPQQPDKAVFTAWGQWPKWYNVLSPYLQNQSSTQDGKTVWYCPSDTRPYAATNWVCSYGMNVNPSPYSDVATDLIPLAALKGSPSKVIYCADTGQVPWDSGITGWNNHDANGGYAMGYMLEYRHLGKSRDQTKKYASAKEIADQGGSANFLFFDGHVETLQDNQLTQSMFTGQ